MKHRNNLTTSVLTLFLAGLLLVSIPASAAPDAHLPEGTELTVRLEHPLSTRGASPGDTFRAKLVKPALHPDGTRSLEEGTPLKGSVIRSSAVRHRGDRYRLSMVLTGLEINGNTQPITTRRFGIVGTRGNNLKFTGVDPDNPLGRAWLSGQRASQRGWYDDDTRRNQITVRPEFTLTFWTRRPLVSKGGT